MVSDNIVNIYKSIIIDYIVNVKKSRPTPAEVETVLIDLCSGDLVIPYSEGKVYRGMPVDKVMLMLRINQMAYRKALMKTFLFSTQQIQEFQAKLYALNLRMSTCSSASRPYNSFLYVIGAEDASSVKNAILEDSIYAKPAQVQQLTSIKLEEPFTLDYKDSVLVVKKFTESLKGFAVACQRDSETYGFRCLNTSLISYFALPDLIGATCRVKSEDMSEVYVARCRFKSVGIVNFTIPSWVLAESGRIYIDKNNSTNSANVIFTDSDKNILATIGEDGLIVKETSIPDGVYVSVSVSIPTLSDGLLPAIKFIGFIKS